MRLHPCSVLHHLGRQLDHLLQPANLTFDPAQTVQDRIALFSHEMQKQTTVNEFVFHSFVILLPSIFIDASALCARSLTGQQRQTFYVLS